jgi:hypothetical protein
VIEQDLLSPACFAVEEVTATDRDTEHILQTEPLGAELNLIRPVLLGPAPLVLDRPRAPSAGPPR